MNLCPACGLELTPEELASGRCHTLGVPFASAAPAREEADRHQFGWRLTLPNHLQVPLADGRFEIGRASDGVTGMVLRLFSQVSRVHLQLEIYPELVRVHAEPDKNPVFLYRSDAWTAGGDDLRPTLLVPEDPATLNRDDSEALTLCIGQCCFLKIDRGEA